MKFIATSLGGAFVIEPEQHEDSRGFFARTFCAREFAERELETDFVQCSISFNRQKGTLRGMHFQKAPACEAKLVRATSGAIYDVIVDLRPESVTYRHHIAVELTAENRRALYVPKMFAHGFQTLEPNTEVFYQISEYYVPEASMGLRYNDPALGIKWPLAVSSLSDKDSSWPFLK